MRLESVFGAVGHTSIKKGRSSHEATPATSPPQRFKTAALIKSTSASDETVTVKDEATRAVLLNSTDPLTLIKTGVDEKPSKIFDDIARVHEPVRFAVGVRIAPREETVTVTLEMKLDEAAPCNQERVRFTLRIRTDETQRMLGIDTLTK